MLTTHPGVVCRYVDLQRPLSLTGRPPRSPGA